MMEKTCGNCPYLRFDPKQRFSIAYCSKDIEEPVVPHHADYKKRELIFWRVPSWCLRTDGVLKSEVQAPEKEWVIKTFKDFE